MLIRCWCAPYSSVPLTTYCLTCSYGLSWFKLPLISYTVRTASCCQTLKIIITMIKCDFSRTSAVSFIQLSVFIFNDKDLESFRNCVNIFSYSHILRRLHNFFTLLHTAVVHTRNNISSKSVTQMCSHVLLKLYVLLTLYWLILMLVLQPAKCCV